MQVLVIIGSPRKGNSYQVAQQIERLLTQMQEVQCEYVFLTEVNLQPCRGCYQCMARGEEQCPLQDERATLVHKMQRADGVIFVSPVYTANVTGLMKNFMDRIAYNAHRPAFVGKPAMLVTTSAGPGTKDTLKALSWFQYPGFEIVSQIGLVVSRSPRYAFAPHKAVGKQIEKAVRLFGESLTQPPVSPPLRRIMQFYGLKAIAMADRTFFLADYHYYHDKENYHCAIEISWWKRVLGKVYYWMATKWVNRRFVPLTKENNPFSESSLPRRPTHRRT